MAITLQKQPLSFFNVNEPAIFEFTTDADLGVNPDLLVADLELKSLWTNRRYVIKNILPNYGTGVFRVDVQGYLKALMLDNFEYRFESPNKKYTIEHFRIGVSVHAENTSNALGDSYVFDSGYIFDDSFVFADEVPNDAVLLSDFYPTIGITQKSGLPIPQKSVRKLSILSPKYTEFAVGFNQTLSVLIPDLLGGAYQTIVNGVTNVLPDALGVSAGVITDAQVNQMYLPTLIQTTLNNDALPVYGISYKGDCGDNVMQFRFYNSDGGYSYFYTPKEALTASRGKSEFINNDFYNQQENRSDEVQRSVEYNQGVALTGVKVLELQDLFMDLLRSPKIEVNLLQGFKECKVTGNINVRKLDFEYTINVDLANANQMSL